MIMLTTGPGSRITQLVELAHGGVDAVGEQHGYRVADTCHRLVDHLSFVIGQGADYVVYLVRSLRRPADTDSESRKVLVPYPFDDRLDAVVSTGAALGRRRSLPRSRLMSS